MLRDPPSLQQEGFAIHRGVFSTSEIVSMREEVERIVLLAGSTSVRRIFQRSEKFRGLAVDRRLRQLTGRDLEPVRSILFDKTKEANWPVARHQDLTIAIEEAPPAKDEIEGYGPWSVKEGVPHVQAPIDLLEQMVTIRIHLDPTGIDNGALCVVPGSHRLGKIDSDSIADLETTGETPCECVAGDVLLMSPLLLHSSPRSTEVSRRRILHFEYAPGDALDPRLAWSESVN